ncbi:major facilitator superfamily domain-containing protein [Flagelloscypha sp. PMI_526]|nr:major facilitator superfamily domain-containing protein [Flagelloscypha sp. PMI_526]
MSARSASPPPSSPSHTPPVSKNEKSSKGSAFWLSFGSILLCTCLSALDLTAIGTMLPTIDEELGGSDMFSWIGTAYALSSTAFMPLSGNLADIFGRRSTMLVSVALFALGRALAGSAKTMEWLIAARTVQGIGGGGILNLSDIIISDLVPLSERGTYQGLKSLTWGLSSTLGPVIGGSFAEKASWRWLFYLNLPVSGIAFGFVSIFLRVRTPPGSLASKLRAVDWIGNLIIIAGTTLCNVGLAWAGTRYSWSSVYVLVPLIVGVVLIIIFLGHQRYIASHPTIPWDVVSNRVAFSGFLGTFIHGVVAIAGIYYMPTYFQAVQGSSPLRSGVQILPCSFFIAPTALFNSVIVRRTKRYMAGNVLGWVFCLVGFGITSLLGPNSRTAEWAGYQIVSSIGLGILFSATIWPVLAPLPVERVASSLAFYTFMRSFAQTWGITICATILQNQLKQNLPSDFKTKFPANVELAYAIIKVIPTVDEPLQSQLKLVFANGMSTIWKTMVGISGAGLLSVLIMKDVPLPDRTDENFALEEQAKPADEEAPASS